MIARIVRSLGWFLVGFFIAFYSIGSAYATKVFFDGAGNITGTMPDAQYEKINSFIKSSPSTSASSVGSGIKYSLPKPVTLGASSGAAVPVKVAANLSRTVPWAKLGASVGAVATGSWPVVLSIAVPALLEYADLQLSSTGTVERDNEVPQAEPLPLSVPQIYVPATWRVDYGGAHYGSTPAASCLAAYGSSFSNVLRYTNITYYCRNASNVNMGTTTAVCVAPAVGSPIDGGVGNITCKTNTCPSGYVLSGSTCNLVDTGVSCPANSTSTDGIVCNCNPGYADNFAGGCASLDSLPPITPDLVAERVATAAAAHPSAAQAAIDEMVSNDVPVQADGVITSGPATSTASRTETSTTTQPDGSQALTTSTTTTNTTNIYQGDTITSTVTNTTTINNADGSTTVVDSPPIDNTDDVSAPSPGILPPVPDLYEQKYPNGFSGVWTARKAELDASPLGGLLSRITAAPPVAAGTCPDWGFNTSVLGMPVVGSIAPPCWLWDVLKAVVILSALFAARRIVFGG
jgi:hypothetical protein